VTKQYGLLGARLPEIKVLRGLRTPTAKAQINPDWGYGTVLVLFPDWCVQCRKMMTTLTSFAAVNGGTSIHAYGLVYAEDGGEPMPEKEVKELRGTLTLEVSRETTRSFGAIDYPLGIVVDKAGLIRFIGVLPGGAFDGGGFVEKLITRTARKIDVTPKTK
jgi:thiol-disulfide isomerase/thioredoxin